ncbi:ankyrin repeat domain-containing protein [Portibacter lacus]|uniref:Ankyrin repeat domain-containing protein n=1 Tax=Portibacter lacus TaxID=1099794 RepID=A0AA37SN01_9BACT|nr:ankyrin repeat domain-containing protein [Portibacter lacus]GLR16041.1 hypothetical protein GCM10007940_06560 [Portibacter lacus]
MKKVIFNLFCIALFASNISAQGENVLHERSFWSNAPTLASVKEKIAAGNDPVALNDNAFDAVTNAINTGASMDIIQFLLDIPGNDINKKTHDSRNYLIWAARTGNKELVKYLLEKGGDPKVVDSHGYNALTFAAAAGQTDTGLYDMLISKGISAKSTNRSGANVLHILAGSVKDKSLIKYFQNKGVDIHSKDSFGNGIFNYAAKKGNSELMKILIDDKLEYLSLNDKGENALMFATEGGRGFSNTVETYKYLASLGMEVDIVNWEGKTPLHNVAKTAKDEAVLDYFITNGVNVNQIDQSGNTAFLNAAEAGNLVAVNKFMPFVKNVNQVNKEGNSALVYAVIRGSKEMYDLLVKNGADLKVMDNKSNNLVYHLFQSYNPRNQDDFEGFYQTFKSNGLSFSDQFEGGNTLIHIAVDKGSKFLLEKALISGADINAQNDNGLTALHLAAMKAHDQALLNLLLDKGADKNILTEFEESAYDLANENEALSKNGMDLNFLKSK